MSVTHREPPEGSSIMPCCGQVITLVPMTDRVTSDPASVTCQGHVENPSGIISDVTPPANPDVHVPPLLPQEGGEDG